jgi:hypothetical protein
MSCAQVWRSTTIIATHTHTHTLSLSVRVSTTAEVWLCLHFVALSIFDGSLRRESPESNEYQIDTLLLLKARQGVVIRIILWAETRLMLNNFSADSQSYLQGLHENIKVIRHPHISPMYYSHHQKTIIVDRAVAFLGGLDLTWGR